MKAQVSSQVAQSSTAPERPSACSSRRLETTVPSLTVSPCSSSMNSGWKSTRKNHAHNAVRISRSSPSSTAVCLPRVMRISHRA